jgi:hypothetical protein
VWLDGLKNKLFISIRPQKRTTLEIIMLNSFQKKSLREALPAEQSKKIASLTLAMT